ncbi:hypothetical protein MOBT1_000475 [Malassezia obtusa]|uniref:Translin n=1 Tax=Malassezia obtusa TaxID=76774 RepID=A0AAF0E1E0_9BASI|nr:hypothetical protein MOBT1_000475 [Malassezia obtusa]
MERPWTEVFVAYRDEIDAFVRGTLMQNDRRERLIKTSRDVTSLSKKLIFHLHRFSVAAGWPGAAARDAKNARLLGDAHTKLDEIYAILGACADAEQLTSASARPSADMLRFERFVGASLEEMIEAATFLYFLEHDALMPLDAVQAPLRTDAGLLRLYVTPERYLLGLSDLTGELMRFAINAVGSRDAAAILERVLGMQRAIYDALEPLAPFQSEIRKKQHVTLTSLRKVEDAAYTLRVRSSEYSDPAMVQEMVRRALQPSEMDES